MKPTDGVTVIAMVLIASFAIDRVVSALLFLLGVSSSFPKPTDKSYQVIYYLLLAAFGVGVLAGYGSLRILAALGIPASDALDIIMTGIILMGGADKITGVLKPPGPDSGGDAKKKSQIEVTGTLDLRGGGQLVK